MYEGSRVIGAQGILSDVSQLKEVEDTLRQNEELFRLYFEASNIGMAISSVEKEWIRVNNQLCKMLATGGKTLCRKDGIK